MLYDMDVKIKTNAIERARQLKANSTDVAKDYLKFANRGNVFELAVGMIIGGAFSAIVNSFVKDIISPFVALTQDGSTLSEKFFVLRKGKSKDADYATISLAIADEAITLNWGSFTQTVIHFFIVSMVLYVAMKLYYGAIARAKEAASGLTNGGGNATPTAAVSLSKVQICPRCFEEVKIGAQKCRHCTSDIRDEVFVSSDPLDKKNN